VLANLTPLELAKEELPEMLIEPVVEIILNLPAAETAWFPEDVPEIETLPPPERMRVGSDCALPICTATAVLVAGPVGDPVPEAPPPITMFPVAIDRASLHELFVFRQALFSMKILPAVPDELDQRTKSPPLV
jgi:hypothetical protein